MKARPVAIEDSYKHFLKTYFLDVYKNNNYIVCYNFFQ